MERLAQDGLASASRASRSVEIPGRALHRGEEDSDKDRGAAETVGVQRSSAREGLRRRLPTDSASSLGGFVQHDASPRDPLELDFHPFGITDQRQVPQTWQHDGSDPVVVD